MLITLLNHKPQDKTLWIIKKELVNLRKDSKNQSSKLRQYSKVELEIH